MYFCENDGQLSPAKKNDQLSMKKIQLFSYFMPIIASLCLSASTYAEHVHLVASGSKIVSNLEPIDSVSFVKDAELLGVYDKYWCGSTHAWGPGPKNGYECIQRSFAKIRLKATTSCSSIEQVSAGVLQTDEKYPMDASGITKIFVSAIEYKTKDSSGLPCGSGDKVVDVMFGYRLSPDKPKVSLEVVQSNEVLNSNKFRNGLNFKKYAYISRAHSVEYSDWWNPHLASPLEVFKKQVCKRNPDSGQIDCYKSNFVSVPISANANCGRIGPVATKVVKMGTNFTVLVTALTLEKNPDLNRKHEPKSCKNDSFGPQFSKRIVDLGPGQVTNANYLMMYQDIIQRPSLKEFYVGACILDEAIFYEDFVNKCYNRIVDL